MLDNRGNLFAYLKGAVLNGMPMAKTRILMAVFLSLLLAACDSSQQSGDGGVASITQSVGDSGRWYRTSQVKAGGRIYAQHCTECHGQEGEGAPNWRKPEPDGKYPPPPLNGTGHAWHHPMQLLTKVIKEGSPPDQGKMPPWGDKLNDEEIISIIAWFQSYWPDQIYDAWLRRERQEQAREAQRG
ncbi:c-type cytochrome [Pseudomonadota bacterium]